jgi:hypothetical protein
MEPENLTFYATFHHFHHFLNLSLLMFPAILMWRTEILLVDRISMMVGPNKEIHVRLLQTFYRIVAIKRLHACSLISLFLVRLFDPVLL